MDWHAGFGLFLGFVDNKKKHRSMPVLSFKIKLRGHDSCVVLAYKGRYQVVSLWLSISVVHSKVESAVFKSVSTLNSSSIRSLFVPHFTHNIYITDYCPRGGYFGARWWWIVIISHAQDFFSFFASHNVIFTLYKLNILNSRFSIQRAGTENRGLPRSLDHVQWI